MNVCTTKVPLRRSGETFTIEILRNILDRYQHHVYEPNSLYVNELLENRLPELDDALANLGLSAENGLIPHRGLAHTFDVEGPDHSGVKFHRNTLRM